MDRDGYRMDIGWNIIDGYPNPLIPFPLLISLRIV